MVRVISTHDLEGQTTDHYDREVDGVVFVEEKEDDVKHAFFKRTRRKIVKSVSVPEVTVQSVDRAVRLEIGASPKEVCLK